MLLRISSFTYFRRPRHQLNPDARDHAFVVSRPLPSLPEKKTFSTENGADLHWRLRMLGIYKNTVTDIWHWQADDGMECAD
jgi:hypothetical protein